MNLPTLAREMLEGKHGEGTQTAMEIIVALAKVYDADTLIPIKSAQVSGVSYKNIGEAGLAFLEKLKKGNTSARVTATLNPCGLDLENWEELGFQEAFYINQMRAIRAYQDLGIETTCSCTPYLLHNRPSYGDHVAWGESSAVSYVNSVLGARTNREGGPAALSAAITGFTANFGLHLEKNRAPEVRVHVNCPVENYHDFGQLGLLLGAKLGQKIPLITGLREPAASREHLRQMGASMAASGAIALYHVDGITPEAKVHPAWTSKDHEFSEEVVIDSLVEPDANENEITDSEGKPVDMVFFGCPHHSKAEIVGLLEELRDSDVKSKVWIATAKKIKEKLLSEPANMNGIHPNVKLISDTCIVVCPIDSLDVHSVATTSGKAYFYLSHKQALQTYHVTTREAIEIAKRGTT